MTVEYRSAREDEMAEYFRSGRLGFGQSTAETEIERDLALSLIRPEWTLCAFDGGVLASKMATLPLAVNWNGRVIPCGGVTAVSTLPSHRRRGHVRELMARSFGVMRDAGQPIALLWATMAAIYQRFGYGMAFATCGCSFDGRQLRFVDEIEPSGSVRIIPNAEAAALTSGVYAQFAEQRMTALARDDAWRVRLTRDLGRRGDTSQPPLLVAVYEEGREMLGYAVYDVERSGRPGPGQEQQILVQEFIWLSPAAHRALLCYLAAYDLVRLVRFLRLPVDDPLFHQVEDPRALGLALRDGAFLRIIDVKAALEGRGYGEDGRLSFVLDDELCPWNSRSWELDVRDGRALLTEARSEPPLALTPRALSTLITGHLRASTLARLGMAHCTDGGVLRAADRLFETVCSPFCPDHF